MTSSFLRTNIIIPTDEEEAEIQREVALGPDAPEWSDDNWSRARPAVEVDPELVAYSRRTRGKQKAPTKVPVYIRLDADIVAHFRQGGRGWQTRLNDALRTSLESE